MPALLIFIVIVIGLAAGCTAFFAIRFFSRRRMADSLRTALFLIKVVKPESNQKQRSSENSDFKAEIAHFEQLLASLAAIKKPISLEVAVPHVGEEIHFYIAVPRLSSEVAAKQIQGLWNGATVELVGDDFNIFNSSGATAAAYVAQKDDFALPILDLRRTWC